MTDAATIARRLTPAQRRALLWLPADGSWRQGLGRENQQNGVTFSRIILMGLAAQKVCWANNPRPPKTYGATPLGLAVRAELERMEAGDADQG